MDGAGGEGGSVTVLAPSDEAATRAMARAVEQADSSFSLSPIKLNRDGTNRRMSGLTESRNAALLAEEEPIGDYVWLWLSRSSPRRLGPSTLRLLECTLVCTQPIANIANMANVAPRTPWT